MFFLVPDGSLTLVLALSSVWPTITAEVPEALAREPLSPILASTLETIVPSGSVLTGRIFQTESDAWIRRRQTGQCNSFDSDEILNSLLVSVCISESNLCKWGST